MRHQRQLLILFGGAMLFACLSASRLTSEGSHHRSAAAAVEGDDANDPCRHHAVLDDYRRSPLYQPETPKDVLCDRHLVKGWYRFTIQNRSAEMPTRCAAVNYCGTQAPIWIKLDDGQRLPVNHGDQIETTGCVSWTPMDISSDHRQHDDDHQPIAHDDDGGDDSIGHQQHETDCCAMKYPITVRSCHSSYLVYKLVPTEACNMAYCSQPAFNHEDEQFDFGTAVPSIRSVFVDRVERSSSHRHHQQDNVYLNCSIQVEQLANLNPKIQFRFHWTKRSSSSSSSGLRQHGITNIRTAVVNQAIHYDLLARNQITAGDKVTCQIEAVTTDDVVLPGGRASTRVLASSTSVPFAAGIAIEPSPIELIAAYKNGSRVNVTLSATVPFVCAHHLSAKDCHLSVQIVQHHHHGNDNDAFGGGRQTLAIAPCSLSLGSIQMHQSESFIVVPISDFVRVNDRDRLTQLQLVVTSYGDAWWHGFQLPNITIQVKDVPPVQCYAFTQGHVIGVTESLDRVSHAGRHLLYSNAIQSFEVWVEYQACTGGSRKDALCICSVEVRSFGAMSSGETFRLERCHRLHQHHPKRTPTPTPTKPESLAGGKRSLPQMSLVGLNPKRRHFRVLESRQGKMITVVLENGAKIRVRTENWGMSVSVVDSGQEHDDLIETIGGLCNPDNELGGTSRPLGKQQNAKRRGRVAVESHLPDEFCTCAPSQDAFLSSVQMHNLPKCDPELEDCPSACQEPQKTVEWTTFFNYLDITDQVRINVGDVDSPHLNLIDQPQRDSASIEDDPYEQFFPSFASWVPADSESVSSTGNNLGRDIYWTTAHGRRRRDTSFKTFQASSEQEDVSLYCSNLLVNSTVALECGQYLLGSFIIKAINICVDDVSKNEDLMWAQEALGLLEDQCEVEASYRRTSDWSRDLLGHQAVSPAIIEALNCPNRCSFQGVCLSFGCVCQPGFSGSDCSFMDDNPPRIERVGNSDGLCDVLANECGKIEITGSGFIDSSRLSCQVQPGKFDGSLWHRGGIGNSDKSLPTSAEFVSHEKIVCHLIAVKPNRHHFLLDDVSEELHLEVKVSNDGQRFSAPQRLTVYHSGCRVCPKSKDGWPLCSDRDDVCYLDNTCFTHGQTNPKNNCEKCDSDRPLSWSFNSANARPVVIGSLKTSVYDGQLLEYVIAVIDDDPDIKFKLMDPLSDAKMTKDGVFRWTAVSNALTSNHEAFWIQVYDDCHPPIDVKLQVEVLPCPCLNGGVCKNEALNDTLALLASNRIHEKRPHYRCECRPGFAGVDCSSRTDHCDPNPCKNGLCLNEDSGFTCKCFNGHRGVTCDRLVDDVANTSLDSGCRCRNGGWCSPPGNKCRCPEGFTGKQCQWRVVCDPACQNGGQCSRRSPGTCNCKKGWTGSHCESAVCESECVNGGRCSSPGKCTCPDGYRGSQCQKPVCKPKCRNGGKCVSPDVCQCPAGFTGAQCQYAAPVTSSTPTPSIAKSAKRKTSKKRSKASSKRRLAN